MAPSQSTLCDSGNEKKNNDPIPLPLVPVDHKAPARDECQEFTLKTDPADADSAKYKFHMHHLKGTEDARGILAWVNDITRVIAGLGVTQPIPAYMLYTQCMRGTALSTFEVIVCTHCTNACAALTAAADNAARAIIWNRTNASFYSEAILSESLNHMITELMPEHILHHTKRYLHRRCRKPADMKVHTFHNHLSNVILNKLPWLPPFGNNQMHYKQVSRKHGDHEYELVVDKEGCIYVPKQLQKRTTTWYHEMLMHPGETQTELTIAHHYTWKGMRKTVKHVCS
jgi:hypothetical protein